MRTYETQPTMLLDPFTHLGFEPDERLIKALHAMLDFLPDNQALPIDHLVAQLLRLHNPDRQHLTAILPLKEQAPPSDGA